MNFAFFRKNSASDNRPSIGKAVGFVLHNIFHMAAANDETYLPFNKAFDRLVNAIKQETKNGRSLDQAEPEIRQAFIRFMRSQDYRLAEKNFEELMKEKSGDKFYRNSGTVSWYHEFLPILTVMSLVRSGTIPMKEMDKYGGLETAICTHLRHDSVEDQPRYANNKDVFVVDLIIMLQDLKAADPNYNDLKGRRQAEQIAINIDLMSQKKINGPDGTRVKEDVLDYTERMVESPKTNPIVFILKQGDAIHNFATLWAPKFTPDRRLKRCDEREDMYGPRHGFPDTAMDKWPGFAKGIKVMDDMMGLMLYTHFRYLESVDRHYKSPRDNPIGIGRYVNGAMSVKLPPVVNMVHIFMDNLIHSVDRNEDPEKHGRLQHFIEKNVKPRLERHMGEFPYLFINAGNKNPPGPGAVAN